ncbi:hypothetical protein [Phreatobacter stygius]|uniref:DUF3617 family protein n=1 Tax=Phreatobacter stygius TaxID=1940610 RepID=A0A4D7AUF2_9HYPH|nr:hypothetical protein [Phreatobacter stygius]QCI63265.1 hypothetical protein E8M01_02870 [Phreatobacter stygius]
MIIRIACLALALSSASVLAQQGGGAPRAADFSGQWGAQPGGPAGVEMRIRGNRVEARELFTTPGQDRCGTQGRGQAQGASARMQFQGRCADGRTTPATNCTVTLETRDRVRTRCQNGHQAVLHRVSR